ncbi:MAG: DNA polymerase IV [Phycisphaerales bacterium JB064]
MAAPGEPRTILHADLDAFFASVEQRDNPELRGKPVLVGGAGPRGVVAAASYEARKFGCRSAMPGAVARRLCPQAIFVKGSYEKYKEASQAVFEVFEGVTPLVEPLSIDEAFLDVTGSLRLLGDGVAIARKIKRDVLEKTRLTVSLGVAPSKLVAKIASDLDKPDGLVVVREGEVEDFLAPLEISRLWGVGAVGQAKLERLGVRTFGDVRKLELKTLRAMFGTLGESLYNRCRGIDDRPVVTDRRAKSIGHERTFGENLTSIDQCHAQIVDLAERVAWRMRRANRAASALTLKVRNGQFKTITRNRTLAEATHESPAIVRESLALFDAWAGTSFEPVRLLGVSASHLSEPQGPGLFDAAERAKTTRVDEAADAIRAKFGTGAIGRASSLER